MARPGRVDGSRRAGGPDDGDVICGLEFQSLGAESEEGRARARDRGGLQVSAASELLWVFLVGVGDAGGDGECGLFGRVCGGAVEVLQKENRE